MFLPFSGSSFPHHQHRHLILFNNITVSSQSVAGISFTHTYVSFQCGGVLVLRAPFSADLIIGNLYANWLTTDDIAIFCSVVQNACFISFLFASIHVSGMVEALQRRATVNRYLPFFRIFCCRQITEFPCSFFLLGTSNNSTSTVRQTHRKSKKKMCVHRFGIECHATMVRTSRDIRVAVGIQPPFFPLSYISCIPFFLVGVTLFRSTNGTQISEHRTMLFPATSTQRWFSLLLWLFFSIHKWVDMNGNVASRSCTTFELCMPSVYQNRMLRFHCILIAFKSLHRQFVSSDKSVNVHLNIFLFIQYITIYHDITQLQTRCKVIGQHFHPRPKFNKSFIGEHAPHFMHTSV